ncbi:LIM/homeobox protein Lhx9-like [Penaeus monodon]|uniref:LIM/homeobox protein Lhx9-like n=1 Tax=Penaeus monodon TaxID=6687 RepID=UPI0018A7ACEE|nr:LIM/homeobox protein Lhx9-like [Penaeus monodon]
MIVDAVRVACGSDGVMVEDEDPLRPPPFSPPLDSGHNPSEANPAAGEARLHAELQSTLIEQQDQQQRCTEKGVVSEVKGSGEVCQGCHDVIADRFLLRVNSRSWHQTCLRCCVCQLALDRQPSCFIREHNVYCKSDYTRPGRLSPAGYPLDRAPSRLSDYGDISSSPSSLDSPLSQILYSFG